MGTENHRVVLAMSGGVDSSVAAHLLARQRYEVIGVFMRHDAEPPPSCDGPSSALLPVISESRHQGCCSATDAEDARRVADELEIPFYALNLQEDFSRIIEYFVDQYAHGRTPNPCVMCNNWLKFGKLFEYADSVGATYVATGHYARIEPDGGNVSLLRGVDQDKDQSYVLFGVKERYFRRMLLPVGGFHKAEIRDLATQFGLRVAGKPDSQEICFVAPGEHAKFVADRRLRDTSGELVTTRGEVVATHDGIERFTIGQRKGLGVAMGEPYFVVRIDAESNRVVIGKKEELACRQLVATEVNWLTPPRDDAFPCEAQIRYNSRATPATATPQPDGTLQITFDEPCFGVAPGQAVVCYANQRVLVGGWIQESR